MLRKFGVALAISGVALFSASQASGANLLFILDASNSMWGQIEGKAKIETAKSTLTGLLADIPADTDVGLMLYGHSRKDDCKDVAVVSPFGTERGAISQAVAKVQPRGKTPIAYALGQSADAFPAGDGENSVVLISDGVESCDGDPCQAAGKLRAASVNVRVHVVGFDLSEQERKQLECIAAKGEGQYFAAKNTAGFQKAVAQAVEVVRKAPEPAPEMRPREKEPVQLAQAPTKTRAFIDDFEGFDLAEHWTVRNPDPDAYIVEEGSLLMVNGGVGAFHVADAPNLVELGLDPPKGDWDARMTFTGELSTGADGVFFGLRKDDKNYMTGMLWYEAGYCSKLYVSLFKNARGKQTRFDRKIREGCGGSANAVHAMVKKLVETPATLSISRRGRSYFASFEVSDETTGDGKPVVYTTDKLTSLRSPGSLTITAGKYNGKAQGEVLLFIDSVEVLSIGK